MTTCTLVIEADGSLVSLAVHVTFEGLYTFRGKTPCASSFKTSLIGGGVGNGTRAGIDQRKKRLA